MIGYTRKVGLRKPEWDDDEPSYTFDELVRAVEYVTNPLFERRLADRLSRGLMQTIEPTYRATIGSDIQQAVAMVNEQMRRESATEPCPHHCSTGLGDGRWRCEECGMVVGERNPDWLRDQVRRSAATLDGLPPEMRETLAHRTRGRKFQVDPELITDFDEVEVAPGVTVAVERKPCPHCPCTYTTECCYCDGSRTPLEDS